VSRQIDSSTARWDSRRDHKGRWTVVVFFNAGGRQRQAEWSFDLLARTVQALDDEARWLSADEEVEPAGPIPAPHLREARATEVYDVEAEGGLDAPGRRHRDGESIDLMAAMRERSARRGRRRRPRASDAPGIDATPDDALPLTPLALSLEEAGSPPAAHPHPEDDPHAVPAEPMADGHASETGQEGEMAVEDLPGEAADAVEAGPAEDDTNDAAVPGPTSPAPAEIEDSSRPTPEHLPDTVPMPVVARNGSAIADLGVPPAPVSTTEPDDVDAPSTPEPRRPQPAPRKPAARKSGRPSVPSWDDIMFGKKPD
jgi:hypothetical protein